ncbi:MAG: PrsW family intramembrane metalloprotease [Candidatus Liptonbacteria bacterium]|nr:PrsW family intramembrane metalloprotease [Candidatus Liptonbacteria bacterium]
MIALIIILGLLPGFAWLFFYLREDLHPEPKRLIALVFLAGMGSAIFALIVQLFVNCGIAYYFVGCQEKFFIRAELTPLLVLIFAFVEEISKFGAAYFSIHKSKFFDEPVDAMVYMAVAALGFATVENLAALSGGGSQANMLDTVFEIASFRFVGATLLHTLTSSLLGYYWALDIRHFLDKKLLVVGIVFATCLHAVFNYLILNYGNLLYSVIFVIIIGFFTLTDFQKLRGERV